MVDNKTKAHGSQKFGATAYQLTPGNKVEVMAAQVEKLEGQA